MQLSGAPVKLVEAFAVNAAPSGGYGGKRTVPVPSQIGITPGAASFNDGFPPLTMTPLPGGVVMSGQDMNGVLNQISAVDWWTSAGGGFLFDSVFAAAVGGYPKGARVLNAAGSGYWLCILDNNSNNPDTGGAGWLPFGGSSPVASVYASAQQTLGAGTVKILWDTVEFDSFGLWNAGGHQFTALWAGKYRMTGSVYLPSPAGTAGQNLAALIYKNGSLVKQCSQFPADSDSPLSYAFDAIVSCAVADTLDARLIVPTSSVLCGQFGSNQAYVFGQLEFLGA